MCRLRWTPYDWITRMPWAHHPERTKMNGTNLRILQLNVMKSRPALINDEEIGRCDIHLIQKPPLSAYQTHVDHRIWHRCELTFAEESTRKRSLISFNKRISMSAHQQVDCNHPDVTAIKLWTEDSRMLLFSVYIQPVDYHHRYEVQSIQSTLDKIESTIGRHAKHATSTRPTTLLIAGDFNRHHPAWSNDPILASTSSPT